MSRRDKTPPALRRRAPRFTTLLPATLEPRTPEKVAALILHWRRIKPDVTEAEIRRCLDEIDRDTVWKNDLYQVNERRMPGCGPAGAAIVHLSVRRLDREPIRDWRHMQRIKNQLVGPECEGVELYPAESRLVDTANQFHMWCIADPAYRWPVGFDGGRFVDDGEMLNSRQRPHDPEE